MTQPKSPNYAKAAGFLVLAVVVAAIGGYAIVRANSPDPKTTHVTQGVGVSRDLRGVGPAGDERGDAAQVDPAGGDRLG
jgi:hypothetical protein